MSSITKKEVAAVAALARLSLAPEEQERFRTQLASILHYAEKLNELDTADVPPTNQITDAIHAVRDDAVVSTSDDTVAVMLENVPEKDGRGVKVHTVLKDA